MQDTCFTYQMSGILEKSCWFYIDALILKSFNDMLNVHVEYFSSEALYFLLSQNSNVYDFCCKERLETF